MIYKLRLFLRAFFIEIVLNWQEGEGNSKGGSQFVSDRKLKPVEIFWPDRKELQNARIQREIQLLEQTIEILDKRIKALKARLVRFH